MQIERVNFADILVASALGAGLILTILFCGILMLWLRKRRRL